MPQPRRVRAFSIYKKVILSPTIIVRNIKIIVQGEEKKHAYMLGFDPILCINMATRGVIFFVWTTIMNLAVTTGFQTTKVVFGWGE